MNRGVKRHEGPATWESKVRGLMLGLAVGDAVGSKRSDVPQTDMLEAGCATQLAAWTVEGLLRTATRYGGWVIGNPTDVVLHAYQRWALLRGENPASGVRWHADGLEKGWLFGVPAMAAKRGSSPSTSKALRTGRPTESYGCQAMLRVLPVAAHAGPCNRPAFDKQPVAEHAAAIAALTHDHHRGSAAARYGTEIVVECLRGDSVTDAIRASQRTPWADPLLHGALGVIEQAERAPCLLETLERLAPDRSAQSALLGAIYVAMSFPDVDAVAEAIEFAGWAPDGYSVAAVAGAILGAVHGFEALPAALVERLELGWVMDRIARDLARQVVGNQAGAGWKGEHDEPPLDPWWDVKYPGV